MPAQRRRTKARDPQGTRRALKEAKRAPYIDQALMPVTEDETETLEMFTHNEGARSEVVHTRKVAALTHGTPALAPQP